jgi:4-hydroxyphenylpyruvate dioxygenase
MTEDTPEGGEPLNDPLPIRDFDHVEFLVGNAKQAAYVFEHAYGFTPVAFAGPETGKDDRASHVLQQGDITVALTAPLQPEGPIHDHVARHSDGVRDVALVVDDVEGTFEEAVSRGAEPVSKPETLEDEHGTLERAAVGTFGDTVHSLVDRSGYDGPFAPGYEAVDGGEATDRGYGLKRVDHSVGNVGWDEMQDTVDWYRRVFGFREFAEFDEKDISTEFTALRSKVVANEDASVKIPVNEPAEGKKKSQIEEYLEFYPGPGIQHLAVTTDDIIRTIGDMREAGVDFLEVPDSYYDQLEERVTGIDEAIDDLRDLRILVDADADGYLLQLFTKPIQDRPTFFFEIIQRKGAESFGKGNFKALFEAIEREQERRGTLE